MFFPMFFSLSLRTFFLFLLCRPPSFFSNPPSLFSLSHPPCLCFLYHFPALALFHTFTLIFSPSPSIYISLCPLTWNQSMVQQLTSDGNFLSLFLKASPIGLMARTMCSWSRTRDTNRLNKATIDPSVCLDLSRCLKR